MCDHIRLHKAYSRPQLSRAQHSFEQSSFKSRRSMTYTTNEEDQKEVARLQKRISESNKKNKDDNEITSAKSMSECPSYVEIDEGAHKYVLVSGGNPTTSEKQYFVRSKQGASYHRNVAEPFVQQLERLGFSNIDVTGGGRILLDEASKRISIYGYS